MSNKTLAEKAGEIIEETFRRLQKLEDSRHDWTELRDAMFALGEKDIYWAFQDWQEKQYEELMAMEDEK